MKKVLFITSFMIFSFGFSQTQMIFRYDQAGNQIYRGNESQSQHSIASNDEVFNRNLDDNQADEFWNHIALYPVPVKDILTIKWDSEVNDLIDHVTLYEHNQLVNLFTKKNLPNINQQVEINMSTYTLGVYILTFNLKDGRSISKNIIKE